VTVPLLTAADVRVAYGDTDTVVDLTGAAKPLSELRVTGAGATHRLTPISQTAPELVPITSVHNVTASGYDSDTLDALATVDTATAMLAVLLTGSGRGWVLPAAVRDAALDAAHQWGNEQVAMADTVWQPTGRGWIITTLIALASNGSVTVPPLATGAKVLLALTTAGSVAGAARKVGVYTTTIAAGSAAVQSARGWLIVARPETV